MKRQILTLGAICAAAFTLTNCNKEIAEPKAPETEGIPFEIVAATADTKTANDGLNTVWTTGDALNVFHAEAGSIDYGTNDQFTYTGAGNKFTGKLKTALGGGKSYDWYALYPVNDNAKFVITSPAGSKTGDGWAYIGHKGGATQNGYNSKAHLAETLCPLYGVVKSVDASTPISFNMKHIASVVKIVVTNESESPLTVNSITFTAPEDIVGSYFMNFTDPNNVVCKASGASFVSSTATLNVTGGTALAKGEKAEFYIPIKPFKAAANNLKITVNGYEKTPVSTADVEFKAGKIETVNFKYNAAPTPGTTAVLGPDWNNVFGTSYNGVFDPKPKQNELSLSGTVNDVTINVKNGKSTNGYVKTGDFRAYNGYTIVLSVPAGKSITKINTTKVAKKSFSSGITADSGTVKISDNSLSWTGNSQKVTLTITGTVFFNTISVTYE